MTRYRNFNILLCLLLVATVTVAATDGISPFQAKSAPDPIAMPKGNVGVPDLPNEDRPAVAIPDAHRAGKVTAQTQGVIRTRGLQIVNSNGQAVVELWPSTTGSGLIFVNSATGKQLVYIGDGVETGDGLININNKNEEPLISLYADEDPGIHISSNSGSLIGLFADEDPGIHISSNSGSLISLFADESPAIHISNSGKDLAYLGANTLGNGLLSLKNNSGKDLAWMYAGGTSGNLVLRNNNDAMIARLGGYPDGDGGFLAINSKTGTELVTIGKNTSDNGLIRVSNSYGTLGAFIVAGNNNGYIGIQDNRGRELAELSVTASGNGLVRTLSPQGTTIWSSNSVQGNTGSSLRGDMDNDGDIDGDDFLLFSEHFGTRR